jgi:predicted nucleotidyltransferase
MQRVLRDLVALETMLAEGMFETDVRRIGAEQEFVLVDRAYQPAAVGPELLGLIEDPRFVRRSPGSTSR